MQFLIAISIGFALGILTSYAIIDRKYKSYYKRKVRELENGSEHHRRSKFGSFK